jgi:molybdenum cofactor synthesis domain-containing protein
MLSAQLLTIGTEITSGEVVNSNASWLSLRLEELGVRVLTHLSVRDRKEDILSALNQLNEAKFIFVTGGLGPTSDDITRECMALYTQDKLEFDQDVWEEFTKVYARRGLPLREAHRWQCWFPVMSARLKNPVGTALGFHMEFGGRHYFVMPGPPKELEGMWNEAVEPLLRGLLTPMPMKWIRWTCLGVPESEAAEVVEPVLAGSGLEVGYRAQIPYVKIKVYADPVKHAGVIARLEEALSKWVVARDHDDLAAELLDRWPAPTLTVIDEVTDARFVQRLIDQKKPKPEIEYSGAVSRRENGAGGHPIAAPTSGDPKDNSNNGLKNSSIGIHSDFGSGSDSAPAEFKNSIHLSAENEELIIKAQTASHFISERLKLPFKVGLNSDRGKRSATEWALWSIVKSLRNT